MPKSLQRLLAYRDKTKECAPFREKGGLWDTHTRETGRLVTHAPFMNSAGNYTGDGNCRMAAQENTLSAAASAAADRNTD